MISGMDLMMDICFLAVSRNTYKNDDELTSVIDEMPRTYASPELDINFNGNGHFEFMSKFMKTASFDDYTVLILMV